MEKPTFGGNNIFLQAGKHVIPAGIIADRLQAGEFGPHPNQTAPPGFHIPSIVQALQQPDPVAEEDAGPAKDNWMDALMRWQAMKGAGFAGTAGYWGDMYGKHLAPTGGNVATQAGADLALIAGHSPEMAQKIWKSRPMTGAGPAWEGP